MISERELVRDFFRKRLCHKDLTKNLTDLEELSGTDPHGTAAWGHHRWLKIIYSAQHSVTILKTALP